MTNRLTSFAVLAALIVMPLVTPAPAQSPSLTPDLLNKLLALTSAKGENVELPAALANPLELTTAGQNWKSRSVAFPDPRPGFHHAFSVSAGSNQDVVFTVRSMESIHCLRVQRSGEIVNAMIYILQTGQVTIIGHAEARKELDAEVAFWTYEFAVPK